jgi:fructose-specific phosphotransferase system IIC component
MVAAIACASVAGATRASVGGIAGFIAAVVAGVITGVIAVWVIHLRHDLHLTELMPWSPNWGGATRAEVPQ